MGGAIAAAFCTQFPNLVDGAVALVASAGNFPVSLPRSLTEPYFNMTSRMVSPGAFSHSSPCQYSLGLESCVLSKYESPAQRLDAHLNAIATFLELEVASPAATDPRRDH